MKKCLFITTLLFFLPKLFAQYINITEIDQSGHTRPLTKLRQTVDLNSQLAIEINKKAITDAANLGLAGKGSKRVDSLIEVLKLYKDYIEKIQITIEQYEQVFQAQQDVSVLKKALRDRALAGAAIVKLFPSDSRFQRRREEELPFVEGKGSNERFRIIMRLLAEEMQYAEDGLRELRKEEGFYFQLAAWSVTNNGKNKIHLEGFDELPPGEFYEYERNQLYLTPDQLKELDSLTDFFEGMNKGNSFEKLTGVLVGCLAKEIDIESISKLLKDFQDRLNNTGTAEKAVKDNVTARLNTLTEKWKILRGSIENLKTKYTTNTGMASAASKTDVLRGFADDIQGLKKQIDDISDFALNILATDDVKKLGENGSSLSESLTKLGTDFSDAGKNLIDYSRDAYQIAVYGRKINTGSLEICKKVLRLALDKIPNTTTLDLLYTGKREQGDVIVLTAVLYKSNDKEPLKTETHNFPMINALGHVHMNVVYSYAKPVVRGSNFKGGPLVSTLYKFKNYNLAYRNFFDPGIGLFVASYDFNSDDTPEFAGGIVTSLFKDYLQLGWGFNFNANQGFWFAGVRIPIPSSPISLLGNEKRQ